MITNAVIRMCSGIIYNVEQTIEEIDERLADVESEDQGFLHITGYRPVTTFSPDHGRDVRLRIKHIETIEER